MYFGYLRSVCACWHARMRAHMYTYDTHTQMRMCFRMLQSREPETELVGANHSASAYLLKATKPVGAKQTAASCLLATVELVGTNHSECLLDSPRSTEGVGAKQTASACFSIITEPSGAKRSVSARLFVIGYCAPPSQVPGIMFAMHGQSIFVCLWHKLHCDSFCFPCWRKARMIWHLRPRAAHALACPWLSAQRIAQELRAAHALTCPWPSAQQNSA